MRGKVFAYLLAWMNIEHNHECMTISLVPRPSHPSICHLQYDTGKGLVKLSHVQ